MMFVHVHGHCPACGWPSLSINADDAMGRLHCARLSCPERDAADRVLDDPETEHVVAMGEAGFTVRHPLIERVGDRLMDCELNEHLRSLDGPPVPPGRWRVRANDGDPAEPWHYERLGGKYEPINKEES